MDGARTYTVFVGEKRLVSGDRQALLRRTKQHVDADGEPTSLFVETTGAPLPDAGSDVQMAAAFNSNVEALSGRTTVMFRLRGYNGEDNDDQVELAVASGTLWLNQTSGPKPLWTTADRWHTTSPWLRDGMLSNDAPRFFDAHAYVADHVLVAHLDSLLVGFAYVPAGTWRGVVVTGRLSPPTANAPLELHDVVLTGRWPINDLLNFVARTQKGRSGAVLCADRQVYDASKSVFCDHVDLSAARDDGSAICDAVSIVYDIDTVPAELAEPIEAEQQTWPDCQVNDCDGARLSLP